MAPWCLRSAPLKSSSKKQEPRCEQTEGHQQAICFDATQRRVNVGQWARQKHVDGNNQEWCRSMDIGQYLLLM